MFGIYRLLFTHTNKKENTMDNLKTGLFGYKKSQVNSLIKQKEDIIKTQQKDIDYLRAENSKIKQQSSPQKSTLKKLINKK